MKKFMSLIAAGMLFIALGATSANAEGMKCGAGKCGDAPKAAKKCGAKKEAKKCGAPKAAKKCGSSKKCGSEKKAAKKCGVK